ncbi:MAG: hypothetical protein IH593_07790 [Bacteroidales bacterium]|nr:hypothetical protein [Bacteroidales bacterium]
MSGAPMSNGMKLQIVSVRLLALSFMLLITAPAMTCMAQRNAARKIDKELFDKKRRGKAFDDKVRDRGAAGKAIEAQKKKEAQRKKDGEKTLNDLKDRHLRMQSITTQERMKANRERTEMKYKAKKQKQRKEQKRPKQYRRT